MSAVLFRGLVRQSCSAIAVSLRSGHSAAAPEALTLSSSLVLPPLSAPLPRHASPKRPSHLAPASRCGILPSVCRVASSPRSPEEPRPAHPSLSRPDCGPTPSTHSACSRAAPTLRSQRPRLGPLCDSTKDAGPILVTRLPRSANPCPLGVHYDIALGLLPTPLVARPTPATHWAPRHNASALTAPRPCPRATATISVHPRYARR